MLLKDAFTEGELKLTVPVRVGDNIYINGDRYRIFRTGKRRVSLCNASQVKRHMGEQNLLTDCDVAEGYSDIPLKVIVKMFGCCLDTASHQDGTPILTKSKPREIRVGQELMIDGERWRIMGRDAQCSELVYLVCLESNKGVECLSRTCRPATIPLTEADLKRLLGDRFDRAELID